MYHFIIVVTIIRTSIYDFPCDESRWVVHQRFVVAGALFTDILIEISAEIFALGGSLDTPKEVALARKTSIWRFVPVFYLYLNGLPMKAPLGADMLFQSIGAWCWPPTVSTKDHGLNRVLFEQNNRRVPPHYWNK